MGGYLFEDYCADLREANLPSRLREVAWEWTDERVGQRMRTSANWDWCSNMRLPCSFLPSLPPIALSRSLSSLRLLTPQHTNAVMKWCDCDLARMHARRGKAGARQAACTPCAFPRGDCGRSTGEVGTPRTCSVVARTLQHGLDRARDHRIFPRHHELVPLRTGAETAHTELNALFQCDGLQKNRKAKLFCNVGAGAIV